MEKNPYIELAECLFPEEMVEYFEVVKVEKTTDTLDVTLEERDNGVDGQLRSNGFYHESVVRDYPVRGRKMSFHIKRRRWIEIETGKSVSRQWNLVAEGTRFSKEFAAFLKEIESTPVSISTLAARNCLKGQTLRKQYKEKISNYRSWDQLAHAEEYILYPENLGADMSLDETCLSNGDVYTILTNKSAHGGKGSLAAMIRGVATDTVSAVLKKIPLRQRLKVTTVTTDLSSAMMLTVRTAFPGASLINDRFHVQQLVSEAVDQLRISHRWEVLEEENKAIREHRARRKAAKTKEERELVGQWEPERMENGETLPQIMARSRHIILKHRSKWNGQQRVRAKILFGKFPDLETAYNLFLKLVDIFNRKSNAPTARLNLARWYNEVSDFGTNEFNKVLETFQNHNATIINYFEQRLTNASAESFNAKIKAFRTQFRGVGDIKFFMFRLTTLYS